MASLGYVIGSYRPMDQGVEGHRAELGVKAYTDGPMNMLVFMVPIGRHAVFEFQHILKSDLTWYASCYLK